MVKKKMRYGNLFARLVVRGNICRDLFCKVVSLMRAGGSLRGERAVVVMTKDGN